MPWTLVGRAVRARRYLEAHQGKRWPPRSRRLGNCARISAAKQAATKARYETVRKPIESTAGLSANAAAARLNERGITTASGSAQRAEQILRARRRLGL